MSKFILYSPYYLIVAGIIFGLVGIVNGVENNRILEIEAKAKKFDNTVWEVVSAAPEKHTNGDIIGTNVIIRSDTKIVVFITDAYHTYVPKSKFIWRFKHNTSALIFTDCLYPDYTMNGINTF